MAETRFLVEVDIVADAIASKLLQSNRVMANIVDRLLPKVIVAVSAALSRDATDEVNRLIGSKVLKAVNDFDMGRMIRCQVDAMVKQQTQIAQAEFTREIRAAINAGVRTEVEKRAALMTNEELTRLLKLSLNSR